MRKKMSSDAEGNDLQAIQAAHTVASQQAYAPGKVLPANSIGQSDERYGTHLYALNVRFRPFIFKVFTQLDRCQAACQTFANKKVETYEKAPGHLLRGAYAGE
ncbi:hypothetical protein [Pseudomonas sp. Leaf127]|uniref:hypothetical protein n=1 Tax=Pseudomonas sp. Leaf127 TaxID=1736267 RepID=UPI0012E81773|nr:hypothetical protein [Pseudomonas sp. Leaf127]